MRDFLSTIDLCPPLDADTAIPVAAVIRMALAVPECLDDNAYEDVGRLLWPALAKPPAEEECGNSLWKEWAAELEQAGSEREHDIYVWLGKTLAHASRKYLPVFRLALARLESTFGAQSARITPAVTEVAQTYGLDAAQARIVNLAVVLHRQPSVLEYVELNGPLAKLYRAVGAATDLAPDQIHQALRPGGALYLSRLLEAPRKTPSQLAEVLALSRFGQRLFQRPFSTRAEMLQCVLEPLDGKAADGSSDAAWSAEQHMVYALLKGALERRTPGVNVLLYGPRGAGKTAFARHLATLLPHRAYALINTGPEGGVLSRTERMIGLGMAQRGLDPLAPHLIMCDQSDGMLSARRMAADNPVPSAAPSSHIPWLTQILESNPHPVIWIMRDCDAIEQECLERFAACIQFEEPNITIRQAIARRHLAPAGFDDRTIIDVARCPAISDAVAAVSAKAAELAGDVLGSRNEAILCILNGHARAQQMPAMNASVPSGMRFDINYLQLEGRYTATQVMEALVRNGKGSVLMSGPPGTGKTQFAAEVARQLGRHMQYVTASDIFSRYVGDSERNVAQLFTSCDPRQQIIFLDEAEAMLGIRQYDTHRADLSVTTEFLRWLEHFSGVLLCATNHNEMVDSAMLRRFVFRLQFKPLSPHQRALMLRDVLSLDVAAVLPTLVQDALSRLDGLTAGDFANVKKRFDLLGVAASLEDWIAELRQEWLAKPEIGGRLPLGFL